MKFIIKGGNPLKGEITLAGAKNAATKMLVASLLSAKPITLHNIPDILDVAITGELCESVGSSIQREETNIFIHTPEIINTCVLSLSRKNRIPILALGPLLARQGTAEIPLLGGDKIGPRPVDMHLEALRAMGALIEKRESSYYATAPQGLKGVKIVLRYPSVGATENALLAAILAKGRTVIENAAVEPEIIDLIKFLQNIGAIIELGTNRRIYIDGVSALHGGEYTILPDRNEAVSFASLALANNGTIFVRGARQDDLITFLNAYRKVGGEYKIEPMGITFWRAGTLRSIEIETDTHPGFMTDWQQPFTVALTQAHGTSILHETVYEDRFGHIIDLNTMGADIRVFSKCLGEIPCRFSGMNHGHSILVNGPTPLHASCLTIKDLRAGMAHVIAALVAEGASELHNIEELDRGYEHIDERLKNIGANIIRSEDTI
ncbi:MAG: UDP-N-acetylglucosamine 1-carboxyvinyltransferase [Patescibacteria group bacterium]|nr:UDP-N-acetylglucosamine 1-carboxyvinyltransferase [Patescibacteria group bacterium]MDE2437860.1 UDP-N-acetylglucosamine 1-carboxyvinyltransferase [Patescibacteria group bacterium]